jgi:hypothetical protein
MHRTELLLTVLLFMWSSITLLTPVCCRDPNRSRPLRETRATVFTAFTPLGPLIKLTIDGTEESIARLFLIHGTFACSTTMISLDRNLTTTQSDTTTTGVGA